MSRHLKIGTRGSPLALAQAEETRTRLLAAHPALASVEIVVIKTTGDAILDRPLSDIGGKGLFTKEIEVALLAGAIDLAVHSMKDMPTILPDGLIMGAYLPREAPWDAFMSSEYARLDDLPAGAVVGTASLRRQAQVLHRRPDLRVESLRGNVQTRMHKLATTHLAATYLAVAGLRRLKLEAEIRDIQTDMLPAIAQGAIGIECRADDADMLERLAAIHDQTTAVEITLERSFLARLDGSCRTPIAGLARCEGQTVTFAGEVFSPDGQTCISTKITGALHDAALLGHQAGDEILSKAGKAFWHDT